MRRLRWIILIGVVDLLIATFFFRDRLFGGGPRSGELRVEWLGRRTASATLPGKVTWCPATRLALVEAVSSDTGLMIVLYERDSITAGQHPVAPPAMGAGTPRPGATVSIRWVRDTALVGFRSEGGSVTVRKAKGTISGSFEGRMRASNGGDSLRLSGKFRDLPLVTTSVGCP